MSGYKLFLFELYSRLYHTFCQNAGQVGCTCVRSKVCAYIHHSRTAHERQTVDGCCTRLYTGLTSPGGPVQSCFVKGVPPCGLCVQVLMPATVCIAAWVMSSAISLPGLAGLSAASSLREVCTCQVQVRGSSSLKIWHQVSSHRPV